MKFIKLNSNDPYYNLAVEEYLFNTADDDIFMLWQNEPCVVIGKNQNAYAEIDLEYAKEQGIKIVRRITGGGAVYHDLNNVNFTFITFTDKAKVLDYEYFTRPIIESLAVLGIRAELSGRNDILVEGKKISGNAQHSANGRILHHGTLLFDTDVNVMSRVLRVNKEKLEYNAVKSHSSRVAKIKDFIAEEIDVDTFISIIEKFVLHRYAATTCTVEENDEIVGLCTRNSSDEWIYSIKRYLTGYKIEKSKKYPFGFVKVEMSLEKDVIKNMLISGDFFGVQPIEKLEEYFTDKRLSEIEPIDVSPYIDKMSFEELYELISR